MTSTQKELEDRLLEVGNRLASPPSDVEELLSLLDQTECFLSEVDQSPSQSMSNALHPALKALVSKELFRHSNVDVKVAVASCVSEITRITAPDAPYDDDLMKEVFQIIVEAFENLSDLLSRSYAKRVSILETVAKVRSCVVMLDLECDNLILDMFRHFFKSISLSHPENVFSSMEIIMTLVIEESEEISSELVSCLLDSVKKENNEVRPHLFRLGGKVIRNCASKLQPILREFFQSADTHLNDYSRIITCLCQDSSDAVERNDLKSSAENVADDSKLSERTVSDELPQGSSKFDQEVCCPEEVASAANKLSRSKMGNGTIPIANGESVIEPTTSPQQNPERSRRSGQLKRIVPAKSANLDKSDPVSLRPHLNARKSRGNRAASSAQLTETIDHSIVDNDKENPVAPGRRRSRGKEADSALVDSSSGKEVESSVSNPDEKDELQPPSGNGDGALDVAPGSETSAKRGGGKLAADQLASSKLKRGRRNSRSQDDMLPTKHLDFKDSDGTSGSDGKFLGHKVNRGHYENANFRETLSQMDKTRSAGKVSKGESSSKRKKSKFKEEKTDTEGDAAGELSLNALRKDKGNLGEIGGHKTKRKRGQQMEEISASAQSEDLDDCLIGSKIKVWWPDDKKFYEGVVKAFNPITKKHKVVYNDGDVETLLLKKERWELIEGSTSKNGGQVKDLSSPDGASEMPQSKKAKRSLGRSPREEKAETPSRSGDEFDSFHMGDLPKRKKGRQKSQGSYDSPNNAKSSEKTAGNLGSKSPKAGSILTRKLGRQSRDNKIRDDRSRTKLTNDINKGGSLSEDDTPKVGRKSVDSARKSISKSKSDIINSGKKVNKDAATSKSNEDTPSADTKSGSMTAPKIGHGSKTSGSLGKANLKVQEIDTSGKMDLGAAEAQESEASTGKRRRRKRQS
ncbi:sister chromatid cohesion protein PDS5 homolog C-like isoform X1 [Typha latifolia]|uniref:sister chromatid cohesion protein PDS5 homolog C-like isoform X1 n=1 Tax=Typha latifolia TaxID=4733 RepID=UPI003C2DF06F